MSILSENLRYLRAHKKLSQQQVANELIIGRGRYSKYEEGKSEPPLDIMLRLSHFFDVSIDVMIVIDLRSVTEEEIYELYQSSTSLPTLIQKKAKGNIHF